MKVSVGATENEPERASVTPNNSEDKDAKEKLLTERKKEEIEG